MSTDLGIMILFGLALFALLGITSGRKPGRRVIEKFINILRREDAEA